MDPLLVTILTLIFGLALGGLAGWFAGSRPAADWKARYEESDGEKKVLGERLSVMAPELATMSDRAKRADELALKLDASRDELTTLKTQAAGFEEQKRALEDSREKLLKEFENTGAQVLGRAQEAFLNRANERFKQSEDAGEQRIKALLEPVGLKLKSYEEQVVQLEAKRVDAFGQLTGLIDNMQKGQEEVRREAQRLGNSLTNAPKARGRWGERALQNVLEQCGLSEHTDFNLEQSIDTADGRLRPDAIVNVPGQKKLVIDAKVSLNAYQEAFEEEDDEARKNLLAIHAKSMRNHVQQLGAKSYQSQFDEAPDYVVMFVPGEHFVAAALEADPKLWDFAFENGVLLATPTNLVAIARTIAQVWRQDSLAQEAQEIGRLGGDLYNRIKVAADHLKRVGSGLDGAVKNYNKFVGSFERSVVSGAKKLRKKGVEIKAEIEEVAVLEEVPNYTAADVDDDTPQLEDGSSDAKAS